MNLESYFNLMGDDSSLWQMVHFSQTGWAISGQEKIAQKLPSGSGNFLLFTVLGMIEIDAPAFSRYSHFLSEIKVRV